MLYIFQTWLHQYIYWWCVAWNCCTHITVWELVVCVCCCWVMRHSVTVVYRLKKVSNDYLRVCLQLHISRGCLFLPTYMANSELDLLPCNSLVSGIHSQLAYFAGVFRLLFVRFVLWIKHLPLYVSQDFGKSILNKFCKFEKKTRIIFM